MRPRLFVYVVLLTLPAFLNAQKGGGHFEPPPIFEQIKERLTPIESVMGGIERFRDSEKPGIVLLNERFEYIVADNERYRIDHNIYYVLEKSGIDPVGKDTFRYRKDQESVHIALAHAIHPDGRVTPVAENAVFIQSPQDEADSNLYTDYEELVVIYPDIDVGSITEHIVITKESKPIIPNHLVHSFYFRFNWPIYLTRYVVDVPNAYADRFQSSRIGAGVPEPAVTKTESRSIWQYETREQPGNEWEIGRESGSDIGPVDRITTFSAWNEVGDWIRSLIDERNDLSDALKLEIDSWTAGLTDREAIIQAVLDKIANDVRYTGLEFGLAGYQPYDCNSVWENKYGDCKDKANLLTAALRYKGIPAYFVLIDTDGLGKFDTKLPSPFHFNHAIAAVENPDGSLLYLDPTVENLKAGDLPPGDVNRNVVVVTDESARIERTPLISSGKIRYEFELELAGDYSVSGWFHLYGNGYFASWYKTFFEEKTAEGLKWNMHERIDGFFPGAQTTDAVFNTEFDEGTPIASAYFVRNSDDEQVGAFSFALPELSWLLPSPGEKAEGRATDFELGVAVSEISIRLSLPGSVKPSALPKDINHSTESYQYTGRWWQEENLLRARVSLTQKTDRIRPSEFAKFHAIVGSMNRWWKTPVTFTADQALRAAEAESKKPFPRLSSAAAQIALVEQLYPMDEKPAERRQALEQTLEWFPDNRSDAYEASMEIVRLDIDNVPPKELAERIEYLIKEYEKDITDEYYAWGEYLLAQELEKLGKRKKALSYFEKHVHDKRLSHYRRGWSAYNAGRILMDTKQKRARDILLMGMQEESVALNDVAYLLISFHISNEDSRRLEQDTKELERVHPSKFDEIIESVSSELESNHFIENLDQLAVWRKTLTRIVESHPALAKGLNALARIESGLAVSEKLAETGRKADALLLKQNQSWYLKNLPSPKETSESLDEQIRASEEAREWEKQTAMCIAYYTRFPENLELASKYFYWTIWNLSNHQDEPELEELVRESLIALTPVNDHLVNASINYSRSLRSDGLHDEALNLLDNLIAYEPLPAGSRGIAHVRYAEALEEMGRPSEALERFLLGGRDHFSNYRIYEGLLLGFQLSVLEGELEASRQFLKYLSEAENSRLEKAGVLAQARRVLAMNQNQDYREAYWNKSQALASALRSIMTDLGLGPNDLPNRLPLIADYSAFSEKTKTAKTNRNLDAYHKQLIQIGLSAAGNEQDLSTAIGLVSSNFNDDIATRRIFAALAELAEFAAYEGSYLAADQLKRYVVHAWLATENEARLGSWTNRILSEGNTSQSSKEFGVIMWAALAAQQGAKEHESFALLEEYIEAYDLGDLRSQAVNLIAALKFDNKEYAQAQTFIETELKHPNVIANKEIVATLNSYLNSIKTSESAQNAFTELVQGFRSDASFAWWNHIQPLNTEDLYNDGILQHQLEAYFDDYKLVEMAKYYLLLAENERETLEVRQDALVEGIRYWQYLCPNPEISFRRIQRLTADPSLDRGTAQEIKIAQLYYLLNVRHLPLLGKLLEGETFLAEFYENEFKHLHAYLKMPNETKEESFAAIRHLLDGPFTDDDLGFLKRAIQNMTHRFGPDSVQPVFEELKRLEIATGQDFDLSQARLEVLQASRIADKIRPFFQKVANLVDSHKTAQLSFLASAQNLPIASLPSLMYTQVRNVGYDFDPLNGMSDILFYFNSIDTDANRLKLSELLDTLTELDASTTAIQIAHAVSSGIDVDRPEQLSLLLEATRRFATRTNDGVMADLHNSLVMRHHHLAEPQLERNDPFIYPPGATRKYETVYRLQKAIFSNDSTKALSQLQTLDTELLTDPEFTLDFYAAAQTLGDDLLAELLRDKVDTLIHDQLSWCISENTWHPLGLMNFIIPFPEKAEKLNWYFDFVLSQSQNELVQSHATVMKAFTQSDWEGVIAASEAADAVVPTFWDIKIVKGIAEFELGQMEAAKQSFKTYLRYRPYTHLRHHVDSYIGRIDDTLTRQEAHALED